MYKGIIDTDSLHLDLLMNSFDSINSPQSVAIKKNTTNMLLSQSEVGEEENENRSLFANKSSYVHKLKDRRVVANSRTNNNGVSTKSKKSIASNLLSKNSRKKVSKELKNLLESNSEFRLSDNSEEEDYFSEEDY